MPTRTVPGLGLHGGRSRSRPNLPPAMTRPFLAPSPYIKLGFFGTNTSGGSGLTRVPDRWDGSWENNAKLAVMDNAVRSAQSAGDNAWMLISSALVLMMTGPGLALFYSGLVRRKNVLATMMQSFVLMAAISVVWAVIGYSLAFDVGNPFVGGLRFAFLRDVGAAPAEYAPTIPHTTWMVYQLMFAIITPALICGAYAERMKFSSMLLFSIGWLLIVYCPLAHMVWGKGGLFNAFMGGSIGALGAIHLVTLRAGLADDGDVAHDQWRQRQRLRNGGIRNLALPDLLASRLVGGDEPAIERIPLAARPPRRAARFISLSAAMLFGNWVTGSRYAI